MKRILITGGAGFIGSNLCGRLLGNPDNFVICMDNLYTGRMCNIEKYMDNERFTFIHHNITEAIDIPVDEIYNAACPASPVHYQKYPVFTTRTCVIGIVNMLDLAVKYNAKIMQFSTSEVYGDPQVHPQPETYRGCVNPVGIRSCYDEGKRCAESLCFDYNRQYGTRIKVIRIFNTYGPGMDPCDGRVVSNMAIQALKGDNFTVYGDGSQTRSFCYIDDLVEGIIKMMASDDKFTGPVNLGNPCEFTIKELASLLTGLVPNGSGITYSQLPCDDPGKRKPDISLAEEVLGWSPVTGLKEGLVKSIEYFKKYV